MCKLEKLSQRPALVSIANSTKQTLWLITALSARATVLYKLSGIIKEIHQTSN